MAWDSADPPLKAEQILCNTIVALALARRTDCSSERTPLLLGKNKITISAQF